MNKPNHLHKDFEERLTKLSELVDFLVENDKKKRREIDALKEKAREL